MNLDVLRDFEKTLPLAEGEPGRALPAFTDMSGAWDLAEEEIDQVFNECMPRGEFCLLASEPGAGKTTLALGIGLSVGLCKAFVAGFTPSRRGRVLMLLGEDAKHPTARRIRAWCELAGVSRKEFEAAINDGSLTFILGESAPFLVSNHGTLTTTQAHREMMNLCESNRYDLVVVDSLIQWSGVPNENDNAMMDRAGATLVDLARTTGGALLALCHTNKASDKSGLSGLHAVRGGGALSAKIRWGAQLVKLTDGEGNNYGIPYESRWRYLRYEEIKNQYAPQLGAPVYFERMEGGVLEAVRLIPEPKEDVLDALIAELQAKNYRMTAWTIAKSNAKEAVNLRRAIARRLKEKTIGWRRIESAIEFGIFNGKLIQNTVDDVIEVAS